MLPIAGDPGTFARGAELTTNLKNPLLAAWTGPFGAPPFSQVRPEHFRPAFAAAIEEQRAEIAAIKTNPRAAEL